MTRSLQILIDRTPVGVLNENGGVWSLKYEPSWQANGYDLSPGLPRQQEEIVDSGTRRPVQWFFDNLLPEDVAREVLAKSASLDTSDAWTMLERFGAESAGAITLLPPGKDQPPPSSVPLSDEELNERIKALPRIPLTAKAPKPMSVAGAQHKLPIIMDKEGRLFEPVGSEASTHLLKPDSTSPYHPNSVVNEWFCARLAQNIGLWVPNVYLRFVPSPVYIIERFDRKKSASGIERIHTLDAAQLLSLSAGQKYQAAGTETLSRVIELCRPVATARKSVFEWVVFNLIIGNGDAHLKNFSLFASKDGYSPTPYYDLVSTGAWDMPEQAGEGGAIWPKVNLTFPVGEAKYFGDVTRSDVLALGKAIGFPETLANRSLTNILEEIEDASATILNELNGRTDIPHNLRAGQTRMVRSIIHLPIKTMREKLR